MQINNVRRIRYKKSKKIHPNLFEYTGIHRQDAVQMQLFEYDAKNLEEYTNITLKDIFAKVNPTSEKVQWLNVHGLHEVSIVETIGEFLNLETYIISEILNISRRSFFEDLDEVLFFSIKSILKESDTELVQVEQISFLIKGSLLVSFQEKKSDFFTHIRERIRIQAGNVRRKKVDYLLFLLLEAVMENFFITLESIEADIEKLAGDAKDASNTDVLISIEKHRENLNFLKRSIIPLRDALFTVKSMQHNESFSEIEPANFVYFIRLHQKSLEILEQIDYDNKSLESASNVFFSSQNQRMNEIMKTLTIFSVIFMPLTFIVGVYGMNFKNMPEIEMHNGYFYTLGAMAIIALSMTYYFKHKDWF